MSMKPFENEIDQILTQAEALLQDEKPTEALALLERGRKLEPRHGWLTLFRGVAFAQLGRTEEATDQLIIAADNNRKDIDIQVDAARHLSLLEQHQDALVCANRAIELEESDAGAQAILGEVLEFPHEQALVKSLLKGDAVGIRLSSPLYLNEHELVDGAGIPFLNPIG